MYGTFIGMACKALLEGSLCPTPTYKLAKALNKIITPFIPNQYSLQSTNDFIDLIHSSNSQGIIASLDVESLFTNVPIDQTIEIITGIL